MCLSDIFRLLGPATAADVLQLTNSLSTQAGPSHTRVVLSNNDLRIFSRPEEDILDDLWVGICFAMEHVHNRV